MSERLAPPNRVRISTVGLRHDEVMLLRAGTRVARVHATAGPHPAAWDDMRFFGPTTSRFDHHTAPRRIHPTRSIAYLTYSETRFVAALAEYFQDANGGVGPIDRSFRAPMHSQFELASELLLLDLDSGWVTRAGGNAALVSGPRGRSRQWSQAIYALYPDVAGLLYTSSVWAPGRCIALWDRGHGAFPAAPLTSRLLSDPVLEAALANAALTLGSYLI